MSTALIIAKVTLVQFFRYWIFAGGAYLIFCRFGLPFVERFRIQDSKFSSKQLLHEIRNSVLSLFIIGFVVSLVVLPELKPFTKIYLLASEWPTWWLYGSLLALILINDTYFYWMHRALHHKTIYKLAHHTHHVSTNPTPLASYSFHPIEAVLEAIWILPVVFFIPIHLNILIAYSTVSFFNNLRGHLSVDFFPRRLKNEFPFNLINSPTHHSHHHKYFNANYGLYFLFWDRICATERQESRLLTSP